MSRKWYIGCLQMSLIGLLALLLGGSGFLAGFASHALLPRPSVAQALGAPQSGPAEAPTVSSQLDGTFGVFWEAWGLIQRDFYGEVPEDKEMTYAAIRGVIRVLGDPNTALIEPQIAAISRQDITGDFEGIGTTVRMNEEGYLVIVQPFDGQPAAQAGLLPNDIILEVDGTSVQGMDIYQAITLIRGPARSEVQLLIQRSGATQPFLVAIIRDKIEIPTVQWRTLSGNVAYLHLNDFHGRATAQARDALRSLMREDPVGLILDLRNNPGGLLDAAVDIGGLILDPDEVILVETRKGGDEKIYRASGSPVVADTPIVVLVNGGSASASEIVAGAIQDNHRGILVGEQTYGKGSVQIPHRLSDGAELRITVAQWFTPGGHELRDGNGLVPDITVPMTSEDAQAGRDPQLDRAVEYLTSGQATSRALQ